MNTTTKRFHRTLQSAFPCDAREAYSIEKFTRANGPADVLLAVSIGLLLAWGAYQWFAV